MRQLGQQQPWFTAEQLLFPKKVRPRKAKLSVRVKLREPELLETGCNPKSSSFLVLSLGDEEELCAWWVTQGCNPHFSMITVLIDLTEA